MTDKTTIRSLWLKAAAEGQVNIPLPDKQTASRIRFALYNSTAKVKQGKEHDPELALALKQCSVKRVGETGLCIQRHDFNKDAQLLAQVLGQAAAPPPAPAPSPTPHSGQGSVRVSPPFPAEVSPPREDVSEIAESLRRLEERLARDQQEPAFEADIKRRETTYYKED